MPRFKLIDMSPRLLPVDLRCQILPGTLSAGVVSLRGAESGTGEARCLGERLALEQLSCDSGQAALPAVARRGAGAGAFRKEQSRCPQGL